MDGTLYRLLSERLPDLERANPLIDSFVKSYLKFCAYNESPDKFLKYLKNWPLKSSTAPFINSEVKQSVRRHHKKKFIEYVLEQIKFEDPSIHSMLWKEKDDASYMYALQNFAEKIFSIGIRDKLLYKAITDHRYYLKPYFFANFKKNMEVINNFATKWVEDFLEDNHNISKMCVENLTLFGEFICSEGSGACSSMLYYLDECGVTRDKLISENFKTKVKEKMGDYYFWI